MKIGDFEHFTILETKYKKKVEQFSIALLLLKLKRRLIYGINSHDGNISHP